MCDSQVVMKIVIIPAIVASGFCTDAYRECPAELAAAKAAFTAYKDSYSIFKVTASAASPDLSETAAERMNEWVESVDEVLSRTNFDSIPDHWDYLAALAIDVQAAQMELDESHILESEPDLPEHIRARFTESVEECEKQSRIISAAEYLCSMQVTPKMPTAQMTQLDEAAWMAGLFVLVVALFIHTYM